MRLGAPDKPIRISAPIDSPDVIVVFHAALTAVVPFLDGGIILSALTEKFAQRNPQAARANERAFKRGAEEFEESEGVGRRSHSLGFDC